MNKYQEEIEKAEEAFYAAIKKVAHDVRREVLIPICKKHRLAYTFRPFNDIWKSVDTDEVYDMEDVFDKFDEKDMIRFYEHLKIHVMGSWSLFEEAGVSTTEFDISEEDW